MSASMCDPARAAAMYAQQAADMAAARERRLSAPIMHEPATIFQYTVMQRTPETRALTTYYSLYLAEIMVQNMTQAYPDATFNILREVVPSR